MHPAASTAVVGVADNAGSHPVPTLTEVLTADPDQFATKYTDIATLNLVCALGLPKAGCIDFPKYLALLDAMAAAVRSQTERSWRLFKIKPAEFHHSENVFRVFTMEHVLRVQFGVKYDPLRSHLKPGMVNRPPPDSANIFIHGVLSEKRTGTCSSLPTFAIAVGRRLGYPLKLVRVPNHTLYRWDDESEKFNYQHTGAGGEIRTDDSYYEWPEKWDADMYALNERTKVWLHSMTLRQEVSKFLCNRAIMLRETGRYDEGFQTLDAAERFDPVNPACADIRFNILERTGQSALLPPVAASMQAFSAGSMHEPVEAWYASTAGRS
ncbi:MAG TPA: transglutaminase family protein [Tepidisphaeraceae bacterium]|nr:transglutaminase family protein [Tepidisphaeraceae bacterium]